MEATKEFLSLATNKLLKDCKIKSKMYFLELYDENLEPKYSLNYGKHKKVKKQYPAFTWGEILWEYAELFFGMECYNDRGLTWDEIKNLPIGTSTKWTIRDKHEHIILNFLMQKKYDEADLYFRENCILINKK